MEPKSITGLDKFKAIEKSLTQAVRAMTLEQLFTLYSEHDLRREYLLDVEYSEAICELVKNEFFSRENMEPPILEVGPLNETNKHPWEM